MTNVLTSRGPGSGPFGDQILSNEENASAFGLNRGEQSANRFGALPGRRTVRSVLRALTNRMKEDPRFKTIRISEDHPQDPAQLPCITWEIDGRQPGIQGKGAKGPQPRETYPREDGTILTKWIQDHSFQVSFHVCGENNDESGLLSDDFEAWVIGNGDIAAQSGIDYLAFSGEDKPRTRKIGDSQTIREHTLHFNGTMEYVYPVAVSRITSIHIWRPGPETSPRLHTITLTRAETDAPVAYDVLPISEPSILVCLHDRQNRISLDYLYGVDYVLYVDRVKTPNSVSIHWLPRGKNPIPGASYYASLYLVSDATPESLSVVTESDTDPAGDRLEQTAQLQRPPRRKRFYRPADVARVLGTPVDLGTISSFSQDGLGVPLNNTPGISENFLEAISRAQNETISVLDPLASPIPLDSGRAFLPSQSTTGL